jgi:S-adenosylhomocysteine hydrolase
MSCIEFSVNSEVKFSNLRKLPLLDFTKDLFHSVDLSEVYLICNQHIVSTTKALFQAFFDLGLKKENLSVIGKCYSTDPRVLQELKKENIDVCESSLSFDSYGSFDQQLTENTKQFINSRLDRINNKKFKKIIVLDDGGSLLVSMDSLSLDFRLFVGVEQTTSGYDRIKHLKLQFPVVNLARSYAKLNFESPIIAILIKQALRRQFDLLNLNPKQILIIGNGSIGCEIYDALSLNYQIKRFDQIQSLTDISGEDFDDLIGDFDLIIGCTGKTVLNADQIQKLKKGCILVSASSSDREFDIVPFRKTIPRVIDCHQNLCFDGIQVLNCGFPINFDEHFDELDIQELEFTRSILLASVLYGCQMETEDLSSYPLVELNIDIQNQIISKFLSLHPHMDKNPKGKHTQSIVGGL